MKSYFVKRQTAELTEAYRALPDSVKRRLIKVGIKRAPEAVALLAGSVQAGLAAKELQDEYAKFAAAIEATILKPGQLDPLPWLLTCLFEAEKNHWVKRAHAVVAQNATTGTPTLLDRELCQLAIDSNQDALWPSFRALARMGLASPDEWRDWWKAQAAEKIIEPEVVRHEPGLEKPLAEPTNAKDTSMPDKIGDPVASESKADDSIVTDVPAAAWLARLAADIHIIEGEMAQAALAKPFDKERAAQALHEVSRTGIQIRLALEKLANSAGQKLRDWSDLKALEDMVAEFKSGAMKKSEAQNARLALTSLRDALSRISGLRIGLRARREELMLCRDQAVGQLSTAAGTLEPPVLPGEGTGDAWLLAAYALADDALDQLLRGLEGAGLKHVGRFIGQTSWDQLVFAQEPAAGTSSGPPSARQQGVFPPTGAAAPAIQVSSTVSPVLTEQASAAAQQGPDISHKQQEKPFVQDVPSDVQAVTQESKQVPVPRREELRQLAGAARIMAPDAKTDEQFSAHATGEATRATQSVADSRTPGESASDPKRTVSTPAVVLAKMEKRELQCLMADYVEALPRGEAELFPAPEVFSVLALQPGLRRPEDEVAEQTRLHLKMLAAIPTPTYRTHRLLLWSAAILPAFVDAGSSGPVMAILSSVSDSALPKQLQDFSHSTLTLLGEIKNCHPSFIHQGASHELWDKELGQLQNQVRLFVENAQKQTLNYQLATVVWHRLANPNGEFGRLSTLLLDPSGQFNEEKVREASKELEDSARFRRLVDRVTREEVRGKFQPIIAAAYNQLAKKAADMVRLAGKVTDHYRCQPRVGNFVAERVRRFRDNAIPSLEQFVADADAKNADALETVACCAARRAANQVLMLFRDKDRWNAPVKDPTEELMIARHRVVNLNLDPSTGKPTDPCHDVLNALTSATDTGLIPPTAAIDARGKRGDVAGARRLLEYVRAQLDRDTVDHLLIDVEERARDWRNRADQVLKKARISVMNARMLGVVAEAEAVLKEMDLVALEKQLQETEAYSVLIDRIQQIDRGLDERTREEAAKLKVQIRESRISSKPDEDRLLGLVDKGDLATAREYLNRLQSGHALPAGV